MWVELVGRVGLVHYGKGNSEPKPLQVTYLKMNKCAMFKSAKSEVSDENDTTTCMYMHMYIVCMYVYVHMYMYKVFHIHIHVHVHVHYISQLTPE